MSGVVLKPILLEKDGNLLHPVLDFDEESYYAGFLLDALVRDKKGKTKEKKVLFVRTIHGLVPMEDLDKEFKKFKIQHLDLRISVPLLTDGNRFSDYLKTIAQRTNSDLSSPLKILRSTFEYIKSLYRRYQDFSEDETYDFFAVWDIGTYFHPMFYSYPYVHIHGLSGTGKTKNLEIGSLICFNALKSGNMRESPLFRAIEAWRPTLFIDETDALASRRNKPDIMELLLNGYKHFGTVWRSEKKHAMSTTYTPTPFKVFCPKRLANIDGLDQILASRAIKITMWRSKSDKYSEEINESDIIWQDARDLCYLTLFSCWDLIKEKYENFPKQDTIINRNWELWKPILTIASLIGEDVYERIMKFAERRLKEVDDIMNAEAPEYKLVKALYRITDSGKMSGWYHQKDIKQMFLNEFEDTEGNWVTSHWIGSAMDRLGFKRIRNYIGRKQYYIDKDFVLELLQRFNIKVEEIKPLEDKKISNLKDKIYDYIKTKSSVRVQELYAYFGNMGVSETEIDKFVDKIKSEGLIYEFQPGVLKAV